MPEDSTKPYRPRYSGRNSHEFWRRVNAEKGKLWDALYGMGVALQEQEAKMLKELNQRASIGSVKGK